MYNSLIFNSLAYANVQVTSLYLIIDFVTACVYFSPKSLEELLLHFQINILNFTNNFYLVSLKHVLTICILYFKKLKKFYTLFWILSRNKNKMHKYYGNVLNEIIMILKARFHCERFHSVHVVVLLQVACLLTSLHQQRLIKQFPKI